MRRMIPLALATLLAVAPLAAQEDHGAAAREGLATAAGMPEGWLVRFDHSGATADPASFSTMVPGWHVTTGGRGAAIFWRPAVSATGSYRLESTIHLMKPSAHPEAFGIFVGGEDLESEDQRYLYFLVRQNGQFLIKRRLGARTENVVGWTARDAIPVAGTDGSTPYHLAIDVGPENIAFIVNGATVQTVPRSGLTTDGVVGIRINHMLDTHVEKLELTRRE
jgi:hypothetical protein